MSRSWRKRRRKAWMRTKEKGRGEKRKTKQEKAQVNKRASYMSDRGTMEMEMQCHSRC
jgi:hypothetical protein